MISADSVVTFIVTAVLQGLRLGGASTKHMLAPQMTQTLDFATDGSQLHGPTPGAQAD